MRFYITVLFHKQIMLVNSRFNKLDFIKQWKVLIFIKKRYAFNLTLFYRQLHLFTILIINTSNVIPQLLVGLPLKYYSGSIWKSFIIKTGIIGYTINIFI